MVRTAYSFLSESEFVALLESKATTEFEVEAAQRLRMYVEHGDRTAPVVKYVHEPVAA